MEDVSRAESPERRRRRPPLACTACRRRKVRCDRKAPCQNCVRARRAAGCAYVVDDRLELREGYQGFSDGINGRSLDKDDVVGSTYLTPAATTTSHHSGHEHGSGPNSGASALAERVRQLEQQLEQVLASKGSEPAAHKDSQPPPHTRPSPAAQCLGKEHWQIGGGAHKAQYLDSSTADNQSCTRGMLAKSRYLGSSHWIHGLTLFPRTNTLIVFLENLKSDKGAETYQAVAAGKALGKTIKAARVPRLLSLDFGQHIPPKDLADELLEAYFRTFESVYRVLHVPSFRLEYGRYWQNPQGAREAFVIQLQLCMAIGAVLNDEKYSLRKLAFRWIYEARLWLMQPSEKSRINLSGLQVWCLVHLARETCGLGTDLVWVSAGTMMRMALYTGLHRDPDHLPRMSMLAAETRRRLWATILEILVHSSIESGGPPLISLQDYDCKPPGNYNDEDLLGDDVTTPTPAPRPVPAFTDTSVQIALLASIRVRLAISSYLNEFRSVPSYDKTLVLNSDLTAAWRRLDALLRICQSQQPGLSAFQLAFTEHIMRRYFLALHLPWLGSARDDPRYFFSRKLCVEIGMRNQKEIRAHGALGSESSGPQRDDFGTLLICASGSYRYTGTQCLLAVILELVWNLEEHRNTLQSLNGAFPGAAPAPAPTTATGFGILGSSAESNKEMLDIVRDSTLWIRARLRAGEVNIKGYLFARAILAEAEGLDKGLGDDELQPLVRDAIAESAVETLKMLKEIHAAEAAQTGVGVTGSATSGMGSVAHARYTGMDGTQVSAPDNGSGGYEAMGTGSDGAMADWDWDALQDPNFNFNLNLNLGAMDLIFGETSW